MLSRLQIALILALAAILFGARAEAIGGLGVSGFGATHYATECSLENVDIIDMTMSCLPDLFRKIVQPILLLVVALLTIAPICRRNLGFSRHSAQFSISPLLYWGLAAGVISLPPDAYNKKEPYNDAALA